jgi:hypothetical protein
MSELHVLNDKGCAVNAFGVVVDASKVATLAKPEP